MKNLKKIFLFVFVLPVTLFFDFVMFSLTRNCASCGSFGQWLSSEAALSFPLITLFSDWLKQLVNHVRMIDR